MLAPIVGGGGGGKADMAQAGGKLPEKLPEAIEKTPLISLLRMIALTRGLFLCTQWSVPMQGRMVGLDVGSVRIGVAVSDPLGIMALPIA